jgi:hypothetical protein
VKCLNDNLYLGYSDWRLPNLNELESLMNSAKGSPTEWLNSQGFNTIGWKYWTSTGYIEHAPYFAWYIDFDTGIVDWNYMGNAGRTWVVREGQQNTVNPCYPANIWKTGQAQSYYNFDDGYYQKGISWPIPRFAEVDADFVRDNLTDLIWTKNANSPGPSICDPGEAKSWSEAFSYIACLNTNGYLGHSDWRLPNRKELWSLIDRSRFNPAIPASGLFINVSPNEYWASSNLATLTSSAWLVNLYSGKLNAANKNNSHYVWPVRGGDLILLGNYVLTITQSGTGSGSVSSVPPGINCGDDCAESYLSDTLVTLNPQPLAGSSFTGWSGDCAGVGSCTVTMDSSRNVTVIFADATPPGMPVVSGVDLTNNSRPTWNWSSGGGGDGTFRIKLDSNDLTSGATETITTSFTPEAALSDGLHTLYVQERDAAGNWSDPASATITLDTTAPVSTPSATTGTFNGVQSVTLSSNDGSPIYYTTDGSDPRTSPTRVLYSGPIPVSASMTLTYYSLDAAGNPEETRTQVYTITYTLTSAKDGNGTGTVTSAQAGIACGGDCSEAYESGSQVILTAAADPGFTFTGWVGCDSVNGNDCTLTINAARSVTATFSDVTPPVGTVSINGGAAITNTASVTLGLTCTDAGGCAQMRFSNDNVVWSEAEANGATKAWTLPAGDGLKTVYAKFKDNAGNWSDPASATITLDTTAPVVAASPSGGIFSVYQTIALIASEPATIHYTTDGSAPSASSPVYTEPIVMPNTGTMTLKFFAIDLVGHQGAIVMETYATALKGDIDGNNILNLRDAIISLQVLTGIPAPDNAAAADIDGNGRIDIQESIYILQVLGGIRN